MSAFVVSYYKTKHRITTANKLASLYEKVIKLIRLCVIGNKLVINFLCVTENNKHNWILKLKQNHIN